MSYLFLYLVGGFISLGFTMALVDLDENSLLSEILMAYGMGFCISWAGVIGWIISAVLKEFYGDKDNSKTLISVPDKDELKRIIFDTEQSSKSSSKEGFREDLAAELLKRLEKK